MANEEIIYFIQAKDSGLIKIGRTSHAPRHRLTAMKIGATEDLHLIGVIRPASPTLEKELHATFAGLRRRGEWFSPDPRLLDYIAENARPWVDDPRPIRTDPDTPPLAPRLQKLLDDRGLSVAEAARMAGLEKQHCWLVVTGRNDNPTWKTIERLVEGVGGTMRELFCEED
jgi:hypothetical protein